MSIRAEAFANAASDCVGAPYRLYGRDPSFGLDCVGLVLHALKQSGGAVPAVPPYRLRNSRYGYVVELAKIAGFDHVSGHSREGHLRVDYLRRGDCLCAVPGPAQLHLLVALGPQMFVHADANRRKIVRLAAPLAWPMLHHFRFTERG